MSRGSGDREVRGSDWVFGDDPLAGELGEAYVLALDDVAVAVGWTRGGVALLRAWEAWVDDCEEGYRFTDVEFDDELRVRDMLESLLDDPRLGRLAEHDLVRPRIAGSDERLRAAFHPSWQRQSGPDRWWHRGVLRRAGHDYAQVLRARGFAVEDLEEP